jgi:hypothetical protein
VRQFSLLSNKKRRNGNYVRKLENMRHETLLAYFMAVPLYLSRNEESWQLPIMFKVQLTRIVCVCVCVWVGGCVCVWVCVCGGGGRFNLLKITAYLKNA